MDPRDAAAFWSRRRAAARSGPRPRLRRVAAKCWRAHSTAGSAAAPSRWCSRARACLRAGPHARAVPAGEFPAPAKYRLCSVGGAVEQVPPEFVGRHVSALHPHQTRYVVPAGRPPAFAPGLPPARAVLAANVETAVNGAWDADLRAGDRVRGSAPASSAAWSPGSRTSGCDVEAGRPAATTRSGVAAALGLRFATPDAASQARPTS